MKAKKIIVFLLTCITLFACVFAVGGCKSSNRDYRIDFNAEFVPNVIDQEFLEKHVTSDIHFFDPELTRNRPYFSTIVIDTKDRADEVYESYLEIDFSKEMLILVIYSNNNEIERSLEDVHMENDELKICIKTLSDKNAKEPLYWQYLTIKMDKVEYVSLSINCRHDVLSDETYSNDK